MTEHKAERAPWGDFPAVVRNGDLKDLSKEPEYEAAKHGDHKAMSYKRMKPAEDELHCEIKALLDRARLPTTGGVTSRSWTFLPRFLAARSAWRRSRRQRRAWKRASVKRTRPGGAAKTMAAGLAIAIRMARTRAVARTNASLVCRMTVIRKASPIRTAGS